MSLPLNLQTITVTGTFIDSSGTPLSGTVTFSPPVELVDANNAAIYPGAQVAQLDSSGHISVTLICTDNPGLYPTGWYYNVTETIRNTRSYSISLPRALGATVDLSTLMPVPTLPGQTSTPTVGQQPEYAQLNYAATWTAPQAFQAEVTVPTPVNATDAVTKAYADSLALGLSVKISCIEATTAALPANTYSNGTSGVGATLTANANGALVIDGVTVTAGDRVLVMDEATASHNGIYTVTATGSGSAAYVLTRATDMNTGAQIPGAFAFVEEGSVNGGAGFVVAGQGPYTVGTTAINFTQISGGGGSVSAGAGLTKTGNVLALTTPIAYTALPPATTTTPGAVVLDGTAGDLQPLGGSGAAGSVGKAADVGHVHPNTGLVTTVNGASGAVTAAFPTAVNATVQAVNFNASVGNIYRVDTTSGSIVVQLPTAPLDRSVVGLKHVIQGGTNTVTYQCGGSDVLNKASGASAGVLSLVNQSVLLMYSAGPAIWTVLSDDLPLPGLDARYLSPMTTLGDTQYESAPGVISRLAGNTTAVKKFYTQTGTGSASAAPGWNAILPADLPAASTSQAGSVEFASSTAALQPAGPAALGTSGLVPDAGHVHPLAPHQFSILAYGAKGDGKISNTGTTNATSTITIGESVLSTADQTKVVMVKNSLQNQSTAGQTTSVGTITTDNSSTSITCSWNTTPTTSASGLQVLWGTDDTAAIQATIAAAFAYAQVHGYAEVVIPEPPNGLFYAIGGPLKNSDGTNSAYNSQLTIPINAEHNLGATVVFKGVGEGGQARYWNTQYPAFSGSTLVSFGNFTSATNQSNSINGLSGGFGGNPSVIGGPTGKFGYGVGTPTPLYNNVCVVFDGITILTTHSNSGWTYSAANMFGNARFKARNFTYGTTGVIELYNGNNGDFTNVTLLSAGLSFGLLLPSNGNNATNYLNNVVCNGGYTYALLSMEHTVGNDITLLYCWSGLCPCGNYGDSGSNAVSSLHGSYYDQICIEACTYHINVVGVGASGLGPFLDATIDTEGTIQFKDTTSGTSLAALVGDIRFRGSPSAITLSASTMARITKQTQLRGPVTSPSYTLGTAQVNTFWRDATVYITGGTVTGVKVSALAGGASQPAMTTLPGVTSGMFRVPAGCWWEIDGSVAPTSMQWVLD